MPLMCQSCGGAHLRKDGSCPFELCVKFRAIKRVSCSTWLQKTKDIKKKKANNRVTPCQSTPLWRTRKRLWGKHAASNTNIRYAAKPTVEAVFSSGHNNHVSTETQKEAAAGPDAAGCSSSSLSVSTSSLAASSSASLLLAGGKAEAAAFIVEQCLLVREKAVGTQNCFLQFRTATFEPSSFKYGSLKYLSALVAHHCSVEVAALGEPRALALYSTISGILQKLPADAMFTPAESFLAALFYIAWELAGTASAEPVIIRSAPKKDVMACVFKLMNYMLAM
jgi:hypothetical protein